MLLPILVTLVLDEGSFEEDVQDREIDIVHSSSRKGHLNIVMFPQMGFHSKLTDGFRDRIRRSLVRKFNLAGK